MSWTRPPLRGAGTDRRPGGRVGLWQDSELAGHPAPAVVAPGTHRRRLHPLRRPRAARRRFQRAATDPRGRDLHGLPGPAGQPRSVLHHRLPTHRGHAPTRQGEPVGGTGAGRRAAQERAHPRPRPAAVGLPAPTLGRHAPACDDRDGAQLLAAPAHRRRADDGTRRDDPGPDRRAAAGAARGAWTWRSSSSPTTWP